MKKTVFSMLFLAASLLMVGCRQNLWSYCYYLKNETGEPIVVSRHVYTSSLEDGELCQMTARNHDEEEADEPQSLLNDHDVFIIMNDTCYKIDTTQTVCCLRADGYRLATSEELADSGSHPFCSQKRHKMHVFEITKEYLRQQQIVETDEQ